MSTSAAGKAYMGIAIDKPIATGSLNYSDYEWILIKGATGNTGATGGHRSNREYRRTRSRRTKWQ